MTCIYVDATTLIALGTAGELDLLTYFDGEIVVLPTVRDEVTTEPARTNLDRFVDTTAAAIGEPVEKRFIEKGKHVLDESAVNGDVQLVAAVLAHAQNETAIAVVSDDRRVRTVAEGFGARVTGTVGVIVRAVTEDLSSAEGKSLVRKVDSHGLHMTGELRETAYELIDEADGQ